MTALQEKAVEMISIFSDDDVSLLIEIMQRISPEKTDDAKVGRETASKGFSMKPEEHRGMSAYRRLLKKQDRIAGYLPESFDPYLELQEARKEKYGCVG